MQVRLWQLVLKVLVGWLRKDVGRISLFMFKTPVKVMGPILGFEPSISWKWIAYIIDWYYIIVFSILNFKYFQMIFCICICPLFCFCHTHIFSFICIYFYFNLFTSLVESLCILCYFMYIFSQSINITTLPFLLDFTEGIIF